MRIGVKPNNHFATGKSYEDNWLAAYTVVKGPVSWKDYISRAGFSQKMMKYSGCLLYMWQQNNDLSLPENLKNTNFIFAECLYFYFTKIKFFLIVAKNID